MHLWPMGAMIFEVLRSSERELRFATARRARRGRGLLHSMAPWFVYLLGICLLFALSLRDFTAWEWLKKATWLGACAAAALSPIGFAVGYRGRDEIEVEPDRILIRHTPAVGTKRSRSLSVVELKALAIEPSLRSLGADILLVAVHRDGQRIRIVEGDPHSGQLRQFATRTAELTGLPLESPRFTRPDLELASNLPRHSQAKQ